MSQAVVLDYINQQGEPVSQLIEPISIVWKDLPTSLTPQWYLLAWLYPTGDFLAFHMASIRGWTPVVDDEGEEQDDDGINVSDQGC